MPVIRKKIEKRKKVFVAMSGGVDSSVTAALLKEAGYDVVGITMCFNIPNPNSRRPSCCGAEGIRDAKRVAEALKIPHYVLDFADEMNGFVIEDFIKEYLRGRTPNPCVRCNQYLKFGALYKKTMALGADYLATGHYARIVHSPAKRCYELKKARDRQKDQSYFLYGIPQEALPKILFPLGGKSKPQVRELARKYRLSVAEKKESQDICFVPDGGYKEFIKERMGSKDFIEGPFKDEKGKSVGRHRGLFHYTIGQRDKLGLALGKPVYVYKIDVGNNTVYVGPQESLFAKGLIATDVHLLKDVLPKKKVSARVRIRYNAPDVKATLKLLGGHRAKVDFHTPQKAVTPGQAVVFYEGDTVLGGATIEKAI
jgi:tRNA-specific 2-thiouridylase